MRMDVRHINLIGGLVTHNLPKKQILLNAESFGSMYLMSFL